MLAELAERDATGDLARIYAEIRTLCAVPYVSSMQRRRPRSSARRASGDAAGRRMAEPSRRRRHRRAAGDCGRAACNGPVGGRPRPVTREHPGGATTTTIGPPARLSRTPVTPGRPVSPPGGDAAEILARVGLAHRLENLVARRVIALD